MEVAEDDRFAVVNVTIKNISDRSFIPTEKISAQFLSNNPTETSIQDIFTERDKELEPGSEITGNQVYLSSSESSEEFSIIYEWGSDQETKFELPNPKK